MDLITKREQMLLKEIYDNTSIIASEQETYKCINKFYTAITKLKRLSFIVTSSIPIKHGDQRVNLYELTLDGNRFVELLMGVLNDN